MTSGFYWVRYKYCSELEVAEYNKDLNKWIFMGIDSEGPGISESIHEIFYKIDFVKPKVSLKFERPSGFYWIKFKNHSPWQPAWWTNDSWRIEGHGPATVWFDNDLFAIAGPVVVPAMV